MATSSSKGAHTQEEEEEQWVGSLQALQCFAQNLVLGAEEMAQLVRVSKYYFCRGPKFDFQHPH